MAPVRWSMVVAGVVSIVLAGPGRGLYGQDRARDADQFIKLGTRLPTLPPGRGGDLFITAPAEFCTDATHELRLNYFPDVRGGPVQLVLRQLAGPSLCQWQFEGLAAGNYEAVLQNHRDGRIVGMALGSLARGSTAVITLQPSTVEIEGRVTEHGIPIPSGFSLTFRLAQGPQIAEWTTPVGADGTYRLVIGTDKRVCMSLVRTLAMNHFGVSRCQAFVPGLQRFDIDDIRIPPGMLRINVAPFRPVTDAVLDSFAHIYIKWVGGSAPYMSSFKVARGIRGEYFAVGYGDFMISVTTRDDRTVLASARVTLSAEHPSADFTPAIPTR